ncbi:MAG: tagaturonate epimerase family protein, partial [Rectinema sp.]
DETDAPQTPAQVAAILVAVAAEKIPLSTFAPRFPGKFLKGIDYVGDVAEFLSAFEAETKIVLWAADRLGLPKGFKLSVHTGSDKFKLYKGIHEIVTRLGAGVHLKTAGTTWLEEIVGLAEADGEGLALAKRVYAAAYARIDELTAPYANVVEIDRARLPRPDEVAAWDSKTFVNALRHEPGSQTMQPDMRQLMHVGFKIAAEMGEEYTDALVEYRESVARNVQSNLYARHLLPIILG